MPISDGLGLSTFCWKTELMRFIKEKVDEKVLISHVSRQFYFDVPPFQEFSLCSTLTSSVKKNFSHLRKGINKRNKKNGSQKTKQFSKTSRFVL